MKRLFLGILVIALGITWHSVALAEGTDCSAPITVSSGQLSGFEEPNKASCAYLGIPYVAAPVGDLRWKEPQPAPAWQGVRKADKYGPWCLQKANTPIIDPTTSSSPHTYSEDCLYLNVWKPKKEGKFPVMVWIHGGGYTTGSAAIDMYRGDRLSANGDVVVVNFNYRLGTFGFFSNTATEKESPNGSTGNYGSLDQVAALKWVKENIAAFGGDPDNVTIFGESAGGWSVCTMVATPLAKGLFQRAIMQSGGCQESVSIAATQPFAEELAKKIGCNADDLACMRKVPAEKLLDAGWIVLIGGGTAYRNHNDGYLLSKTPLEIIRAGEHNKVPMIIGSNRDEARPLVTFFPKYAHMTKKKLIKIIREEVTEDFEKVLALYDLSGFPSLRDAYAAMMTDRILACPGYTGACAVANQGTPVYYYRFDYDNIRFAKRLGAFHGLEIPFVYNNLDRKPTNAAFPKKTLKEANALSLKVQAYWINFARAGDPNGGDLLQWPTFEPKGSRKRIHFDTDITVETEPVERDAQCGFWETQSRFPNTKSKYR